MEFELNRNDILGKDDQGIGATVSKSHEILAKVIKRKMSFRNVSLIPCYYIFALIVKSILARLFSKKSLLESEL